MSPSQTKLHTVGDVARLLGTPIHRVEYILKTRPQIRPIGRVGIARVYDDAAVELVRNAINEIASRQLPVAQSDAGTTS